MSYSGPDYPLDAGYERGESLSLERVAFVRRTYAHLAGAILAFIAIEFVLFAIPTFDDKVFEMLAVSPYSWLVVLVGFMAVGWLAESWAQSDKPKETQYLGLGIYVLAEALITFPLLVIATRFFPDQNLVGTAGILTVAVFAGLTVTVFITKKDFSFLGPILTICSFLALGVIIASIAFGGFNLGMFFTLAMIALIAGYILYYTSNVMLHYRTDQHVAAALALFAAVAVMFWYILRLLMILASSRE